MAFPDLPIWPFAPNWSGTVTETLTWLTDILASKTGAEQRRSLRQWPKQTIEYVTLLTRKSRRLHDNLVTGLGRHDWMLPIWFDQHYPEVPLLPGYTFIPCVTAQFGDFKPNGWLMLVSRNDPQAHRVLQIASVDKTGITLIDAVPSAADITTQIVPLKRARFNEEPVVSRETDETITGNASFTILESNIRKFNFSSDGDDGPLIQRYLTARQYQAAKDSSPFDPIAGTTDAHVTLILACFRASESLSKSIDPVSLEAADYYKSLAFAMLDAFVGDGSDQGPIVRQAVPTDPLTITVPHWLYAAKGDIDGIANVGEGYEMVPTGAAAIVAGFSSADPQTFRDIENILTFAIAKEVRPNKQWATLRSAFRRTNYVGRNIADGRDVLFPLPGYSPVPAAGEPLGLYSQSAHLRANATTLPSGVGPNGGANFFQRIEGGDVLASVPDSVDYQSVEDPNNLGQFIITAVPKLATTLYGRRFYNSWRVATNYQNADQYLFVQFSLNRAMDAGKGESCVINLRIGNTVWSANLTADAIVNTNGVNTLLIPRDRFTNAQGALPPGQVIEAYDIAVNAIGAYLLRVRALRHLAGASAAAVAADVNKALAGDVIAYSPGVAPFRISADVNRQRYIGFNGIPALGAQRPDMWADQLTSVNTFYSDITPAKLSVVLSGSTSISFPISPIVTVPVGTLPAFVGMPSSVASVVAMGDSFTAGVGASSEANRYLNLTAAALSAGAPNNQGRSGTVLQNSPDASGQPRVNNGRDRYVVALTGANAADRVIIAYGFNDARYTANPNQFNVAQYINDYQEIITGLLALGYTRDRIIVVTPHWISDIGLQTGSEGFTGQTRAGFEEYVVAARNIANQFGVYLADSYVAMRDNGGAALITGDRIHPNDQGHYVISRAILAARRSTALDAPVSTRDIAKPPSALLAEQNLLFMKASQDQFASDGGKRGPFAHSFVTNIEDRRFIPNAQPHTWVYDGYLPPQSLFHQARAVESICRLFALTSWGGQVLVHNGQRVLFNGKQITMGATGNQDSILDYEGSQAWSRVRQLAEDIASDFLTWYLLDWPGKNFIVYNGAALTFNGKLVSYTDIGLIEGELPVSDTVPNPAIRFPYFTESSPHIAAVVLRAVLWLKSSKGVSFTKYDPLILLCWNYLETFWHAEAPMRYTWSTAPNSKKLYALHHGEIMLTISRMMDRQDILPADIDKTLLEKRLQLARLSFEEFLVGDNTAQTVPAFGKNYRGYSVMIDDTNEKSDMTVEVSRLTEELDNNISFPLVDEYNGVAFNRVARSWWIKGREKDYKIRAILWAMRGRSVPIWVPTIMQDFKLINPVAVGDYVLTVEDCGYTASGGPRQGRRFIMISLYSGERLFREILSSAQTGLTETIRLDQSISQPIALSQIVRISFIELMRFDQDEFEIAHTTDVQGIGSFQTFFKSVTETRKTQSSVN